VITDDDIVVSADWLGAISRPVMAGGDSVLCSGRVLPLSVGLADGFAPSVIDDDEPRIYRGRTWVDVLYGNNMAFSRALFDRLGPFDVRLGVGSPYRAASDNDYCFRALEAGCQIRYLPEAVVYHQEWRSKKALHQLRWGYGVGQGAYLAKHVRIRDRYTLIRLRNETFRHAKSAASSTFGDRRYALAEAAYALGLLYGSARWMVCERMIGG
jgi:GT2 family glycosyltransferase